MIPLFLELQAVNGLNNLPVLCLVYAVMQFPFCIFTLQGFMSAVPRDYEESARIDGATNIQLLLRVMVPLAKPGIATITMLSAMGFWNEYPLALVLLTEDAKKTLPIGMANLFEVQKYATDWGCPVCRTCNRYDPNNYYLSHWTEISASGNRCRRVERMKKGEIICQLIRN